MTDVMRGVPRRFQGGAQVLRRLASGPVTESWLFATPEGEWVLRRDQALAADLGLDREAEWSMLRHAHGEGLGPRPLWHDAPAGLLLRAHVPGDTWASTRNPGADTTWYALGGLLRQLHGTPANGLPRLDLGAAAARYAAVIGEESARLEARAIGREASRLMPAGSLRPCHNDAHLGNVIGPGVLIDWEYAALGHPLFDLAVVVAYHQLGAGGRHALVAGWAGDVPLTDPDPLPEFLALYEAVARLWTRAIESGQ